MQELRDHEVLVGGIDFGEGPRWHDGRLWYSDFYRHGVFAPAEPEALAQRVFAGEDAARHRLVDDDDGRTVGAVRCRERPSLDEGNLHRAEVAFCRDAKVGLRLLARARTRTAFHDHGQVVVDAGWMERQRRHGAGRLHIGNRQQAFLEQSEELHPLRIHGRRGGRPVLPWIDRIS